MLLLRGRSGSSATKAEVQEKQINEQHQNKLNSKIFDLLAIAFQNAYNFKRKLIKSMKLINVGVKLTEDDISEVENELDVKLSQDYKAFLLQNNGGSLTENLVFDFTQIMPESGKPFDNSSILREFSILSDLPFFYGNLIGAEVIPEKSLPIASDPFDNEILLCADENNYGKIYFGDHETYDPETDYWLLTELANSFTEFIDKLYLDQEE